MKSKKRKFALYMQQHFFPFEKTQHFSKIFLDYVAQNPALTDFYGLFPKPENFIDQLQNKPFGSGKRQILYQALARQYANTPKAPTMVLEMLLQENTFTVTTGHQLCVFTGPLYFHYKIMTAIKTAQYLRKMHPQYNFVPVYWMASEDHDFEEIRSIRLFGKKYDWKYESASGAVGKLSLQGVGEMIAEMPEMDSFLAEAYAQSDNLAEATRLIVNELYGHEGLVVIDGDDPSLKREFLPLMFREINEQPTEEIVKNSSIELEKCGYKAQVFPRPINLFYMKDDLRERIERQGAEYQIVNTNLRFSEREMLKELQNFPERFSPNVVLRPLYQEHILPNLAYIGGPGELAYWFQLKGIFEYYQIPFPILMPRNFMMLIGKNQQNRMQKLGFSPDQVFLPLQSLKNAYVKQHGQVWEGLETETDIMNRAFEQIIHKVQTVDPTLKAFAEAEKQRLEKSLEAISKKTNKAEEQKHETAIKQMTNLLDSLFPNGNLQEREDNFLNFHLNDPNFLQKLLANTNPFDFRLAVWELD